jgi:uncharacterized protein YecE (DUF72 family)
MIRIGTCSWKYDSWKGILYPERSDFNYLEEYSKHCNTVEIDQWFWSLHAIDKITLPKTNDVKLYAASVADDFKFTIKIPNSITLTHFYQKKKTDPLISNPHFLSTDIFNSFIDVLSPLHSKIGVLMFQFEYLNKLKMGTQLQFIEMFESFLNNIKTHLNIGIEVRNPNYLNKNFFEFLHRNNLAMVFLQGYYMPMVWEVFKNYKEFIGNVAVVRLHGPDRKGIEEKIGSIWNQIVEPKDDELDKISELITFLDSKIVDVYVNVNNHFEGSAPLTIEKLKEVLKGK